MDKMPGNTETESSEQGNPGHTELVQNVCVTCVCVWAGGVYYLGCLLPGGVCTGCPSIVPVVL